jgi:hypothetical protein
MVLMGASASRDEMPQANSNMLSLLFALICYGDTVHMEMPASVMHPA